jgi:hypothetical protein
MDDLLDRIQTLEQDVQNLQQQTTSVARRLRWWRRLACSLAVLTVFSLPLSLGAGPEERRGDHYKGDRGHHHKPKDDDDKVVRGLVQRVRALERKLQHVTSERDENGLPHMVITGANLRIVNGLGRTDCTDEQGNEIPACPNGLGNLIVGYNEPRPEEAGFGPPIRTGSHNVVVGQFNNFSRFGGLVGGLFNTISGEFASVSGGSGNTASGSAASVSGGQDNTASGILASVSGGISNAASGNVSSVSGGSLNAASGDVSSVSGGQANFASATFASVSGGTGNFASNVLASVSGGFANTASGNFASVSGGLGRTAEGEFDWVAGGLVQDQ